MTPTATNAAAARDATAETEMTKAKEEVVDAAALVALLDNDDDDVSALRWTSNRMPPNIGPTIKANVAAASRKAR